MAGNESAPAWRRACTQCKVWWYESLGRACPACGVGSFFTLSLDNGIGAALYFRDSGESLADYAFHDGTGGSDTNEPSPQSPARE